MKTMILYFQKYNISPMKNNLMTIKQLIKFLPKVSIWKPLGILRQNAAKKQEKLIKAAEEIEIILNNEGFEIEIKPKNKEMTKEEMIAECKKEKETMPGSIFSPIR